MKAVVKQMEESCFQVADNNKEIFLKHDNAHGLNAYEARRKNVLADYAASLFAPLFCLMSKFNFQFLYATFYDDPNK